MNRSRRAFLALSALSAALAASPAASAEPAPTQVADQESTEGTKFSDAIVVTASRTEQDARDVPATITTLDREEASSSPILTFEGVLQQYVPGFALLRNGSSVSGDATVQAVHLRGTGQGTSSHTLVLLDGVPLVDPFGGWVAWGRIPTESVERVEVVRTGNATAWGNLALGGVVQVITRKPERRELSLFAEGGNLDTVRLAGRVAERHGAWGFDLGGSFFDTDGFVERAPRSRGPIDVTTRTEQRSARARIARDFSPNSDVELATEWWSEDRRDVTRLSPGTGDALLVRASGQALDSREALWRFTLFGQETGLSSQRTDANAARTVETPSLDQFDIPATSFGGSAEWGRPFDRHQLTAGADLSWVEGSTNEDFAWVGDRFTRRRHAGGEQRLGGLFLADLWQASPRWSVSVSARADRWRSSAARRTERSLETGETLLDLRYEDRGDEVFTPSVGAVYRPIAALGLRAALFTGFRAPNLNELHRPFRTGGGVQTEANAALEPERSRGAELGFDLAGRRGRLSVAAYWNRVDDPIVTRTIRSAGPAGEVIEPCGFVPPNGRCARRENLGQLESRGAELEGRLPLGASADLAASYVYIDSEITAAPHRPELEGKPLVAVPEHQATLRLTARAPGKLDLFLAGRYIGRRTDDDLGAVELPSFVLLDLGVSRPVGRGFVLSLAVENAFDRAYETRRDRIVEYGAPRQVRLGVRYRWPARWSGNVAP